MRSKFVLAAFFVAAAAQVFSQTSPSAIESPFQLFVGAGFSGYDANYFGDYLMEGGTIWMDVFPNRGPKILHGFGLEAEGRDISLGRPSFAPSNLREDTGGGGVIYKWRHFHNFSPYAKLQWEHASIDFQFPPDYNHDTRDLWAGGVGVDYRVGRNIWVRVGGEQQYWERLFQNHEISTPTGIILRPRGFTVGASYEFSRKHPY
jgi:opacity protein-like surface antigen